MTEMAKSSKEALFSHKDDFVKLNEVAKKYPAVFEIDLVDTEQYQNLLKKIREDGETIPVFIKNPDGHLDVITRGGEDIQIGEEYKLVCLGKMLDIDLLAVNE